MKTQTKLFLLLSILLLTSLACATVTRVLDGNSPLDIETFTDDEPMQVEENQPQENAPAQGSRWVKSSR